MPRHVTASRPAYRHLRHPVTPSLIGRATSAARIAALVLMLASPAHAVRAPETPVPGTVRPPGIGATRLSSPTEGARLARAASWQEFLARHGAWSAVWNARTGSPHRAFGAGIELPGFADDEPGVEAAVRAFIASHPGVFGSPALETVRVQRVRQTWYLSFRQTLRGLPVLFSDWEFRVGANGRLFAFGADAHRVSEQTVPVTPRLPVSVLREAARLGVPFDPARDRIEGGGSLALLPVETEDGTVFRTVDRVRVLSSEPAADWSTLVDAGSGQVLWRENRVRHAIGGTVTGNIHPVLPTDPTVPQPFANLTVTVGGSPANTNASGGYSAPAAGTVTVSAALSGPYCNVNRQDGFPDASFSTSASDPATVNIVWTSTNSHEGERDGFYHVNVVHDYVKALDPGATNLDYVATTNVNASGSCNAFYSPSSGSLTFYAAGGGCPNMATMPDVVYHEYGHAVNEEIYQQAGQPSGMGNGALHEGMADVLAAFVQDSPDVGKGFFGPGTVLRTIDNTRRWPQDASGDGHITGLIIGGAFWDLRQAAGLAVAAQLSHFAKYGLPDDSDDGVAMQEYFVETLVADDDDADLSNGTPHAAEIIASFNLHGIGTVSFLSFGHTPLADQSGTGAYPVTATVAYTGPIGALSGAPSLHYAYNNGAFQTVGMTPTGNPNEYTASIPGTSGAVVQYYLSAMDTYGETGTDPSLAPTAATHRFLAGPAIPLLSQNMESDPAWEIGAFDDNATTGIWIRDDPVGTQVSPPTYVQPEDDHTFAGIQCFVTGNAPPGAGVGVNDVDGGKTTLTTAFIDATATGYTDPVISYWRWYTNNQGASPGTDIWRVDISNDGGFNWVSVENTSQSEADWRRILFRIADYVTPTTEVRLRFIAEDAGAGSLVEAAVDDFELLGFPDNPVAVGDAARSAALTLALASSHPASGALRLSYAIPETGPVSLILYDLGGRAVRTLVSGEGEAGSHAVEWDGRDDDGRTVASGTYFARLSAGGRSASRTLVRAR